MMDFSVLILLEFIAGNTCRTEQVFIVLDTVVSGVYSRMIKKIFGLDYLVEG